MLRPLLKYAKNEIKLNNAGFLSGQAPIIRASAGGIHSPRGSRRIRYPGREPPTHGPAAYLTLPPAFWSRFWPSAGLGGWAGVVPIGISDRSPASAPVSWCLASVNPSSLRPWKREKLGWLTWISFLSAIFSMLIGAGSSAVRDRPAPAPQAGPK